jgi:hypothetical protein
MSKILILGGYGNFGWRICRAMAKDNIPFIIAGRNEEKAEALSAKLKDEYPNAQIDTSIFDVNKELDEKLQSLKPTVVINTCGPFQAADYSVAKKCIKAGIHYIDLADGRDFVKDITQLDQEAKANNVLLVSGASTVPGLSSAVLEKYKSEFSEIDSLIFGIAPGQKAPRGLATTQAILTYVGKPLKPFAGSGKNAYGWQDLYRQKYPELGTRWMANCDIPDLDLLPERYSIKSIRFSAGMENSLLHLGIWAISWLVRLGIPLNLPKHAKFLWKASTLFDIIGSEDGGMHMIITGKDSDGNARTRKWFIIGKKNEGPNIPTIPAIVLAKKLYHKSLDLKGAHPCVGLVSLEEYMEELKDFSITQHTEVG